MMIDRWILAAALAAAVAACGGGQDGAHAPEALPDAPARDSALHVPPTPLPGRSSTSSRPPATITITSTSKE